MKNETSTRSVKVVGSSENGFIATSWGEQCKTLLSGADTMKSLLLQEYKAPKNFGPPKHLHRNEDENFIVKQGNLVIWTPEDCKIAGPGDSVMLPKGIPHTWRAYGEDSVHLHIIISPGEFETFFEDIVNENLTVEDVNRLVEVASNAGMDILGPPLDDNEVQAILQKYSSDNS